MSPDPSSSIGGGGYQTCQLQCQNGDDKNINKEYQKNDIIIMCGYKNISDQMLKICHFA